MEWSQRMIIRHVIETIINPFFICLLLFFIFLVVLYLYGNSALIRSGFLCVFLLLLLFSTGWLPKILTQRLENQYPIITQVNPQIHWIVVLSGGQFDVVNSPSNIPPNALLNSVSLDRLVEGIRLYRQLPNAKLLLSGGGIYVKASEALHLSQVASWFEIPKSNLVLETTSLNTAAEAKAIQPIVGHEPFYLVTSAIHMPRAMALCKAQGLQPIAAPTDFSFYRESGRWERIILPSPYNLNALSIVMHEILGSIAAKNQAFFDKL